MEDEDEDEEDEEDEAKDTTFPRAVVVVVFVVGGGGGGGCRVKVSRSLLSYSASAAREVFASTDVAQKAGYVK